MTREEILDLCRRARDVGTVKHEDFADYVIVLQQRKKVDEEWVSVEAPYMSVDGRVAMAREDHRLQNKRLDFLPPQVLKDTEEQLTLLVTVESEIYGKQHGIATSRRVSGTTSERDFPWEVAETSAVGRALAMFGYGIFPGSGIESAEGMERAGFERKQPTRQPTSVQRPQQQNAPANGKREEYARPRSSLSAVQRRKLLELYRNLHEGNEADATRGLDAFFIETFKHGMSEASYEEGAHITAQLLAAQRAR